MDKINGRTLIVIATVMTILTSVLLVVNWIEGRATSRSALASQMTSLGKQVEQACATQKADYTANHALIADHEQRLRVVEDAYNQQVPVMKALAQHFDITLPGR